MKTLCGIDCKEVCSMYGNGCKDCVETNGRPFGGDCIAYNYAKTNGVESLSALKQTAIKEINALNIPELKVSELYYLTGSYVNLEYTLSNGSKVKFLQDNNVYMGCQVERANNERCYGVVVEQKFIIVSEYGCNGADPELIAYVKRK